MGSGGETARETVAFLAGPRRARRRGAGPAVPAVPGARAGRRRCRATVRRVAVLDRTKEPGSLGEPLFLDVLAALSEAHADGERELMPRVIGGRYGLSSKEFTPAMVAGVFEELARERPKRRFTIGINDDVSRHEPAVRRRRSTSSRRRPCARCSSAWAPTGRSARTRTRSRSSARRACTRRATSSTTPRSRARRRSRTCASGRSRSARRTWSRRPSFVGCHQFGLLERPEVLDRAAPGATLLLNTRHPPDRGLGRALARGAGADPRQADRALRDRRRADRPRRPGSPDAPTRCCRPASSRSPACWSASRRSSGSRPSIAKTYGRRGAEVVERNQAAVDRALDGLHRVRAARSA